MSLHGKKVVIIGGSSGIGLHSAIAAVAAGAEVVIASRSGQKLAQAVQRIGGNVTACVLDVTREEEVSNFFSEGGRIDHLVTTAVSGVVGQFLQLDCALVRQLFESKFWGQYYAARYGAPFINPGGAITLFAGVASQKPLAGLVGFAAVNGAIESLCRALALELAPLRVNAVSPGVIANTELDGVGSGYERNTMFSTLAAHLPAGRIGRPEDVAAAVMYLMQNGYTTGTVVYPDGGQRLL